MTGPRRYESIDQFRGFAILSMVLVNVLGRFSAMPETFRHARFERVSFADAVAPFFFFIVGLGFRISFVRNRARHGAAAALLTSAKRSASLFVIAVFVYHFAFRRIFWDALSQIAFGSFIALPVIGAAKVYRLLVPFGYAGLVLALGQRRILGVPFELESASWPLMILAGSIAADWFSEESGKLETRSLAYGAGLAVLGFGVYFFGPVRVVACALIYLGASFLILAALHGVVDRKRIPLPHLTTLGRNALVVYILHYYVDDDMRRLVPDDAGVLMALLAFAVVYFACYSVARYLERRSYFVTI